MSDGKRIASLTPDTVFSDAASLVLRSRLDTVGQRLAAVRADTRDADGIHQLRVATRRADAAVRLFRGVLPGKVYREGRLRLREIRRAAGGARDWDVFALEIAGRLKTAKEAEVPGLDFLLAYAVGRRDAAETGLSATLEDNAADYAVFTTRVVDAVKHENTQTLGDAAPEMLSRMRRELNEAAFGDLTDYDHLHRVRIFGKRLRYAMEILASCEDDHDRRYADVEAVQEMLGRANDSHVAISRLTAIRAAVKSKREVWARQKAGVEGVLAFHRKRLTAERRAFARWWTKRGVGRITPDSAGH